MKKYNLLFLLVILFVSCNSKPASTEVRRSVLAGSWYSSDAGTLTSTIDSLLQNAKTKKSLKDPLLLILPHAGYQYSGRVAAAGYNIIKNTNPDIIVLLAPSHHSYFKGCSILPVDYYETPLGRVKVEKEITKKLLKRKNFNIESSAHKHEHAIEIHLPFLQRIFKNKLDDKINILPILVGNIDSENAVRIAKELMDALRGEKRPLFIVSTDFTHYGARFGYLPFKSRRDDIIIKKLKELDFGAIKLILKKDLKGFSNYVESTGITICGRNPIKIALSLPVRDLSSELVMYDTSGNITGDFRNSVSYAAIVFGGKIEYKDKKPDSKFTLSRRDKIFLIGLARRNIRHVMLHNRTINIDGREVPHICRLKRGAFVTLKIHENLRGCTGYIDGVKPLYQTVIDNSYNAAFRDHRFPPLSKDEFRDIKIEISVLTEPREIDSIEEIEVGRDGLIIVKGASRGLLLPQVSVELGWNREEFLIHTCKKARLSEYAWRDSDTKIFRFQAIIFKEDDLN